MQTVTISRPVGKPHSSESAPVVFVQSNIAPDRKRAPLAKQPALPTGTKFLSIARPRAVSAGAQDPKNAARVARAKSDGTADSKLGDEVRMPALVLTKLPFDTIQSPSPKMGPSGGSSK